MSEKSDISCFSEDGNESTLISEKEDSRDRDLFEELKTIPNKKLSKVDDEEELLAHKKRVQSILDQKKYLEATEWMFTPCEHYIDGTASRFFPGFIEESLRRVGEHNRYPFSGVFDPPDDIDVAILKLGNVNISDGFPVNERETDNDKSNDDIQSYSSVDKE